VIAVLAFRPGFNQMGQLLDLRTTVTLGKAPQQFAESR
jgi:hypothetical protein